MELPIGRGRSHWVVEGPFEHDATFFFDLRTGEAFKAADNLLSEEDVYQYWELVEAADRKEVLAFLEHGCFKATHVHKMLDNNNSRHRNPPPPHPATRVGPTAWNS